MTEKRKLGFAMMDPLAQREIASQGGREAHRLGVAHQFTSEEARIAGAKGGRANRERRTLTLADVKAKKGEAS